MPAKRLSFAIIATRCAAKKVPAKARLPSARAACLARAPLRLTDTSGPAQTSETSQTVRGLSAPVGGRALGLRSEGSWLAAELLRAGLEPGAVDRRAGWTGFCPSNDQPSPRCAPPSPRPRAPHAPRRARAHPPCPSPRALGHPFAPSHNPCVSRIAQISARAFEQHEVLYVIGTWFSALKWRCRGQNFLPGLRPAGPDPWPGTGCAGGGHSGVVW